MSIPNLDPLDVVQTPGITNYTPEYLARNRVAVYHIVRQKSNRTLCGRPCLGWILPLRGTSMESAGQDNYCKTCLRIHLTREEKRIGMKPQS